MEQEEHPTEGNPVTSSLTRSSTEEEGTSTRRKRKKKKELMESIIVYRSETDEQENDGATEGSIEEEGNVNNDIAEEDTWSMPPDSRYVTLTGTITRGKRKGQMVDIHVNLTDKGLRELARSKEWLDASCQEPDTIAGGEGSGGGINSRRRSCAVGPGQGPHVLLWSVSCLPVVFVLSFITSFFYGTLTWYNVFLVYNEERTFLHKVTLCPVLILTYPPLIVILSLGMAFYAAFAQLSWVFAEWWLAVRDLEKGFCGWACGKMGLEDCAPYSVVELLDSDTLSGTLQMKRVDEAEQVSSV